MATYEVVVASTGVVREVSFSRVEALMAQTVLTKRDRILHVIRPVDWDGLFRELV